ncbi:hypothetical protein PG999_007805 [Apiospora kogelbergensis]|uniref:Uncharacterized protein n=1 Tax=Apiospora kogelbergensis TaxID=1337665 RepID=A0AAW0QUE6_9PEZI
MLDIIDAPVLTSLDLGHWSGPANRISIHRAPKLGPALDRPGNDLIKFNASDAFIIELEDVGWAIFPNMTSAGRLQIINSGVSFDKLNKVDDLAIANPGETTAYARFESLQNVYGLRLGNASVDIVPVYVAGLDAKKHPNLVVESSMVIGPWDNDPRQQELLTVNIYHHPMIFPALYRVGGDLNITKNSGIPEMSFSSLTGVKRLHILNNPNSTVPGDFSALEDADFIHINGKMNTYVEGTHAMRLPANARNSTINPALFPRLNRAAEVKIEAWNPDFDCSRLVHMNNAGIIGYLSCNGTNGTTGDDRSGGSNSSTPLEAGLSRRASLGIGVGVGVLALGVIGVLAWLIKSYRRKLRAVTTTKSGGDNNDDDTMKEVSTDTRQEGRAEAGSRSLPYEALSREIVESGGTALCAEAEEEHAPATPVIPNGRAKGTHLK